MAASQKHSTDTGARRGTTRGRAAVRGAAQGAGDARAASKLPEEMRWPRQRVAVLLALTRAAMAYWHSQLVDSPRVIEYLGDERGYANPVVVAKRYGLGYSPGPLDRRPGFVRHVLKTGFPGTQDARDLERALVAAGLARRKDNGQIRDLFYGRLMFPIAGSGTLEDLWKPETRIVGFGGRAVPGAVPAGDREPPKYINSPESVVFQKRKMLYGWSWARASARKSRHVAVLEGYFDCLRLWEVGIAEAVASCGTALTSDHMQELLWAEGGEPLVRARGPFQVLLATDADSAGRRAAERGSIAAMKSGMRARIVEFDGGKDPDEILKEQGEAGVAVFRKALADAQTPVMNYLNVTVDSNAHAEPLYSRSLRALVGVLRNLQRRTAGADESLVATDAERVAARLRIEGLVIPTESVLDLFRSGPHATLADADVVVGSIVESNASVESES